MEIFFVVPYTPTPIRARPYWLLRALAERGHRITLFTLWENAAEHAALEFWRACGLNVVAPRLTRAQVSMNLAGAAARGLPMQARYAWQPTLAHALTSHLRSTPPDVVHVEHLRGSVYASRAQQLAAEFPHAPPVIWDSVDCISFLFRQAEQASRDVTRKWISRLELARTRQLEARLASDFARVAVTAQADRDALQTLARSTLHPKPVPSDHIVVMPNGVALDYFQPQDIPRDPETVLFTGKLSYHANVTAAVELVRNIMPHVWRVQPKTCVQIVGQNPTAQVRALAGERVQVIANVADVRPYLARATVAVAPMAYSAGIQNKVLEAMAMGTPVVATRQAAGALRATPGQDFFLAADPTEFSAVLVELLATPQRRAEMATHARRYVEQFHNWKLLVQDWEALYSPAREAARRVG